MKKVLLGFVIAAALLAGLAGIAIGGLAYKTAFENQQIDDHNVEVETDLTQVAGYTPAEGDAVVELKSEMQGGNTQLVWETGKVQGGKPYEFDGTWTSLGGAVVYNAKASTIQALEVVIVIESFNSYGSEHPAPGGLVNTVIGKGTPPPTGFDPWFNIADHPNATFTATEFAERGNETVTPYDNAPENWTHLIKGTFELNGVSQELELPAVVTFSGETLSIETNFTISRATYGIAPKNPLPGSVVDDIIKLTAGVKAEPDAGVAVGALAQMINDQGAKLAAQQKSITDLTSQIAMLNETLEKLDRKIASGAASAAPKTVDVANLPKTYTDKVAYPGKDPYEFEMVLVPGEGDVAPFYMAKHEVTWAMFYGWAYGADIDANQYAQLQGQNLRPSPLYEDCNQLKLGLGERPALSMSRTTAIAFAKWVSEQTGKSYRIPTDKEWQTALKLGGIPQSADELKAQAVFVDNADIQDDPPFLELTGEVGSKAPNKLGIHDLIGNAAEWVVDTGADQYVRGGHFLIESGEFDPDWKSVEDQLVWNETYPQLPLSRFWYRDHYYQGIRLVADVE